MLVRRSGFPTADAGRGFDRGLPVPQLPAQGGGSAKRLVYNYTLM
jgi:hypothetical protein